MRLKIMTSCKFNKKGLMTVKWNGEKRKDEVYPAKHPILHINDICEFDKGVTLKAIMNLVASDELLTKIVAIYSSVNHIEDFHKEINQKCSNKDKDVDYLEIYRSGEIFDGELSTWTDWHGVNTKEKCDYCGKKEWPDHGHYISYSYTPTYEVANIPIKLNERLIIRENYNKVVLDVNQKMTLLEILHAIYYDISFHGGPKDRDKFLKEMNKQAKDIKKNSKPKMGMPEE
jgi:hypothetical protein